MSNASLDKAKKAKNDEFYTRYEDIEKEVNNYSPENFRDRVIYCNCDSPYDSNFFKYFVNNFNRLKLKKLICTGFGVKDGKSYKAVVTNVPDSFYLEPEF